MNYLHQYDEYSCAPIGLINALKWCGCKFGARDLPSFQKLCKTKSTKAGADYEGTCRKPFAKAIKKFEKCLGRTRKIVWPTLSTIEHHIFYEQGAVLIDAQVETPDSESHISLIIPGGLMNSMVIINEDKDCKMMYLQKWMLQKMLKRSKIDGTKYPAVWLIPRASKGGQNGSK